jgi:hypothetical protein
MGLGMIGLAAAVLQSMITQGATYDRNGLDRQEDRAVYHKEGLTLDNARLTMIPVSLPWSGPPYLNRSSCHRIDLAQRGRDSLSGVSTPTPWSIPWAVPL